MQPTSVLTKSSVWYELGVLWAIIAHVERQAAALAFFLQIDIKQNFKWGMYIPVSQEAAKISVVKVGGQKKFARSAGPCA